ncbi:hypothetical protein JW979_11995 [bacterium]|nr:hypothetical protein [candidate division CSSED10-310 bacterium]
MAKQHEKYKDDPLVGKLTDYLAQSVYRSPVHFALEMIQNADDAESTEIRFYFEKNKKIIVTNNGKRFSENDVRTICYAGFSLKKKKKGFFGIGFKSVKRVTDCPQIISSRYNFIIHDYYHPEPCNAIPDGIDFSTKRGAIFILPVRSMKEYKSIKNRFYEETNEHLLLFLDHVKRVFIIDRSGKREKRHVLFHDRKKGVLHNSYNDSKSYWKVYKKTIKVPAKIPRPQGKEAVNNTELALAFPTKIDVPPKPQKLFCFLPTDRITGYPFIVQGDFLPVVGRSDIDTDNAWNKFLLDNLPVLVADAFDSLKTDLSFRFRIMSYLPEEATCHDEIFSGYIDEIYGEICKRDVIFTRNHLFRKPSESIYAPHEIWKLFDDDDLKAIYKKEVFIASDGYNDFERGNLSLLGVTKFDLDDILKIFRNEDVIKKKMSKPRWFVSIYAYIWENYNPKISDLKSEPILLTQDNHLVAGVDGQKTGEPRLISNQYMNMETSFFSKLFKKDELIFLNRAFMLSQNQRREGNYNPELDKTQKFFDSLGVIRRVEAYHIVDKLILPKFQELKDGKYLSQKRMLLFTKYILENLSNYRQHYGTRIKTEDWEIFSKIRSGILVIAEKRNVEGKSITAYLPPEQVYVRGERKKLPCEKHFGNVTDVPFLSRKYFKNRFLDGFTSIPIKQEKRRRKLYSWMEFFDLMGCWGIPRVIKKEKSYWRYDSKLKQDFPGIEWSSFRYDSTSGYRILDWEMSELRDIVRQYKETNNDIEKTRMHKALCYIKESLEKNWMNYGSLIKAKVSYFYRTSLKAEINSTFFQQLTKPWIPRTSNGELIAPSRIFKDTAENRYLAPAGYDFATFSQASKDFYKTIGVREEPDPFDALNRLAKMKGRWDRKENIPDDSIKRLEHFYRFLSRKSKTNSQLKEKIEESFSKQYLIFLPMTFGNGRTKIWWHRKEVFAKETLNPCFNPYFQPLFQEGAYSEQSMDSFVGLGVRPEPGFQDYLDALNKIKKKWENAKDTQEAEIRGQIKYLLEGLSVLIEGKNESEDKDTYGAFNDELFLTDQNEFLKPEQIYVKDDYELEETFRDEIKTLLYDGEIGKIASSLKKLGFKSLKDSKESRKASFVDKESIRHEDIQIFRDFGEVIESFIENRFSFEYDNQRDNIDRFKALKISTAKNIKVTYFLDGKKKIKNNVLVYLGKDELVLSCQDNDPWKETFNDELSRCLASVFGILAPHLRPLFVELHQNQDDINSVIGKWGLEKGGLFKK